MKTIEGNICKALRIVPVHTECHINVYDTQIMSFYHERMRGNILWDWPLMEEERIAHILARAASSHLPRPPSVSMVTGSRWRTA